MADLIDRQAALDALEKEKPTPFVDKDGSIDPFGAGRQNQWYRDGIAIIRLPPAQPEHGQWIDKYGDGDWHCTRCGAIVEKHEQGYRNWYFCYHCGAQMDEVSV